MIKIGRSEDPQSSTAMQTCGAVAAWQKHVGTRNHERDQKATNSLPRKPAFTPCGEKQQHVGLHQHAFIVHKKGSCV